MANRQPAVLDQKVAHVLWELIETKLTFRKHITRRTKRDTIGFVDMDFWIPQIPGCKLGFRNLTVSRVNGKPRIDMPSEQGKDGKWYPHYYPLSYELREVLTQRVFLHPEVQNAVAELPQHAVQDPASSKPPSPFGNSAPAVSAQSIEHAPSPTDNPFPPQGEDVGVEPSDEDIDAVIAEIEAGIEI